MHSHSIQTQIWNDDLKRSLLARHANYEANDVHKQHIYKNTIVKLDAQRSDIKAQANGTVITAPKLGSGEIDQLVLSGTGKPQSKSSSLHRAVLSRER